MLTGRSTGGPGPPTLVPTKASSSPTLFSPKATSNHNIYPLIPVSPTLYIFHLKPHYTNLSSNNLTTMPPKAVVGPDEDVKFLLTVTKQLSGTVSAPTSRKPTELFANSYSAGLVEGVR
jgi:hypothetical protein